MCITPVVDIILAWTPPFLVGRGWYHSGRALRRRRRSSSFLLASVGWQAQSHPGSTVPIWWGHFGHLFSIIFTSSPAKIG